MTDDEAITEAANTLWAQLVVNSPNDTFTPRDRQMFELGYGMLLVAMKAAERE